MTSREERNQTKQEKERQLRERQNKQRGVLEKIGVETVRHRHANRMPVWDAHVYRDENGHGINPPNEKFVQAWLDKKDAAQRQLQDRRFRVGIFIAVVGIIIGGLTLVAAWIAAYPVLHSWLSGQ